MKTFLLFFSMLVAMACSLQQPTLAADVGSPEMGYSIADAGIQTFVATDVVAQNIDPPNAGYGDVLNLPGKDDGVGQWLYWFAALLVLLLYEIVFRLVPTAKSISLISFIYNILNMLLKDRSTNGGVFSIKATKAPS